MATLIRDTYKLITILQDNGFTAEQADALKTAFDEIDVSSLSTKQDIHELRAELYKVAAAQVIVIIGAMVALAGAF